MKLVDSEPIDVPRVGGRPFMNGCEEHMWLYREKIWEGLGGEVEIGI